MNKDFRGLMETEARAAEGAPDEDDGQPLPPHVKVSRPNRARSKVLHVRLNPDEFDALEMIAAQRGLPVSTLARDRLLLLIREDEKADVGAQLTAAADRIKELAALVGRQAGSLH